jgi:hypothetical protein
VEGLVEAQPGPPPAVQRRMDARVRITAVALPVAGLLAGVVASTYDLTMGILAAAFALGWTQLSGL